MLTLFCVIFTWMIVFGFVVMFLLSKDYTPGDMPDPRSPFSKIALLVQQLRTSGAPLG